MIYGIECNQNIINLGLGHKYTCLFFDNKRSSSTAAISLLSFLFFINNFGSSLEFINSHKMKSSYLFFLLLTNMTNH